ncbi:MAG: tetratricopeptide repeat protein, partial [Cyanobacteria bacterium P01_G01_bin.39]
LASYERTVEIDPNDDETWYNRGVALGELGRLEEALASYDRAIEIKPDYDSAWYNRGNTLFDLGRLEEALASYEGAIEINPGDDRAWFNRIEVIFKQNNWDKGFKDLDIGLNHFAKGEEFYPGDIAAYLQIIWDSTTDIKVWQSRLQTLVAIYDKHQVVSTVGKGIVAHIPNLMSDLVSDKLARAWLEIWQEIAEDKSELTIALRLLKTAVEYKEKKGDRKILLRLAKEEREILEPLIKKQ